MSPSMNVARLVKLGSPLEVGTADQPTPGPMEVVVKVAACGLVRPSPNFCNSSLLSQMIAHTISTHHLQPSRSLTRLTSLKETIRHLFKPFLPSSAWTLQERFTPSVRRYSTSRSATASTSTRCFRALLVINAGADERTSVSLAAFEDTSVGHISSSRKERCVSLTL